MHKIVDTIRQHEADGKPYYSFEFFPPVTDQGTSNLLQRIERMAGLKPSWHSVTWGAGGSTDAKSLHLAQQAQAHTDGIPSCLHLTCTNMERTKLDAALQSARLLGINNILALRGDPPRGEEYWVAADENFQHAGDLVRCIRKHYGDEFCIGVAGYPEGHSDAINKEQEIQWLKGKVDDGADFIVTQLFYDTDLYLSWFKSCREAGITVPIVAGVMPLQSYQTFRRIVKLCQASVPQHIYSDLEPIATNDQAVKEYGVHLAVDMVKKLQAGGAQGFHFCTLNLEKSVKGILYELGWAEEPGLNTPAPGNQGLGVPTSRQEHTSWGWDEFPNGRLGDVRSPAYGELDGWGVSLKLSPAQALLAWGRPQTRDDITALFAQYLCGTLATLPWCDEPLMQETSSISPFLAKLTSAKGWWTVASQPAVDGVPSTDATYGFGPKGGYIYQKAFVEFWAQSTEEVMALANRVAKLEQETGCRDVTFYAAAKPVQGSEAESQQGWLTNMTKGDANAVTWGVFPGKEVVTPTLIEEVSFKAWRDEAFEIWSEWSKLYPASSKSRSLLENVQETHWLVSVVHHDYKRPEALWEFLLR